MSVKKSSMFRAVAIAIAALAVAGTAVAKDNKKKDKKEEDKKTGGMMEEGGKDPFQEENLDEGAYTPGEQKKAQKAAEAEAANENKPKPHQPPVPRKTWGVFAEALIGWGRAPVEGPAASTEGLDGTTGDATAFAFMVGGHYDLNPAFRLSARVPFTVGTVKSGTQDVSTQAIGAPEVAARLRLSKPSDTEWAVRLAVGIPVAQGNPDFNDVVDSEGRAQNYLQRVADAANGWHDPELYTMKRIPISPALLFSHRAERLRLGGEFKIVVAPAIGGDFNHQPPPNQGSLSTPGVAVIPVLGGSATYEIFTHGHLGLAAWARYGIVEQVKYEPAGNTNIPTHFQFAVEPKFLMQFGHVVPGIGFVLPIGGQLGGNIYGFRAHVDVIF